MSKLSNLTQQLKPKHTLAASFLATLLSLSTKHPYSMPSITLNKTTELVSQPQDRLLILLILILPYLLAYTFLSTKQKTTKVTALILGTLSFIPLFFFTSIICIGYCYSHDKIPLILATTSAFLYWATFIFTIKNNGLKKLALLLLGLMLLGEMVQNSAWNFNPYPDCGSYPCKNSARDFFEGWPKLENIIIGIIR